MKKSLLYILLTLIVYSSPLSAQGLLKKVGKAVSDELQGTSGTSSTEANAKSDPDPACACEDAELIVDLAGNLKLYYKEMNISTMDDGSLLLKDLMSGNYYIVNNGTTTGPFQDGDSRLKGFDKTGEEGTSMDALLLRFKDYISKSGDKYLITFSGKTYGPYARINSFVVPRSKDIFAAMVVETIVATEDEGRKMDEAIKNAKTDQERMQLAMKYSQMLQQKMMQGGGANSILPKFITNVEGATYDPMVGGTFNSDMKYNDILVKGIYGITDLKGNKVIEIKPEHSNADKIFINSANNRYAVCTYGALIFNDNKTYDKIFNTHLRKGTDGKIYLAYMYYSPKRNAIMQCKILF
jgi:hypothetical protein